MKTKKITLLFTILCISTFNGMERELPRPGKVTPQETVEIYQKSLPELKQHILNIALAKSNDLLDAIKTIKAFSTLHRINYNNTAFVNLLMKQFPTTVKDVIVFAVEKPELYQKIDTILKQSKNIEAAIDTLKQENIPANLKDFTVLIHMIKINPPMSTMEIAKLFKTPLKYTYIRLGDELLNASTLEKIKQLIEKGADINVNNSSPIYQTPLNKAVIRGDVDLVTYLLNAGADPYFTEPIVGTALNAVVSALKTLELFPNSELKEKLEIIKTILEQRMKK